MRETIGIEFRTPTDLPTASGVYYARIGGLPIRPVWVKEENGRLIATQFDSSRAYIIEGFEWFGSVREVREASCP